MKISVSFYLMMIKNRFRNLIKVLILVLLSFSLTGCTAQNLTESLKESPEEKPLEVIYSSDIPGFSGEPIIELNNNRALFKPEEITNQTYENYSPLDSLGRVGVATACLGLETLPTQERESISDIKPTGWNQTTYNFIDGESLYNRSHLIAYSLSAENDNVENLMTGTRYFNNELMKEYELEVLDYIENTGNHVMYRITPRFTANNLLADGVQMEAYSVEDSGKGVNFNVFCYNIQPGVIINYVDGSSQLDTQSEEAIQSNTDYNEVKEFVLNKRSKKVHLPDCPGVKDISDKNKVVVTKPLSEILNEGYTTCGICKP